MKRLLCLALAVLCLAGCTNVQPTPTPVETPPPTPVSTPSSTPEIAPTPMVSEEIPYEQLVFDAYYEPSEYHLALENKGNGKGGSVYKENVLEGAMEACPEAYFCMGLGMKNRPMREILEERGFRVYWEDEKLHNVCAIGTVEMVEALKETGGTWAAWLAAPPRPEGYPETVGDALAYLLEHDAQETYRVGVFLKGGVGAKTENGFENPRILQFLQENSSIVDLHGIDAYYEKYWAFLGVQDWMEMKEADAEAALQARVDGVLARYDITPDWMKVSFRFGEDRPDFSGDACLEAELSGEAIRALMMDEDVLYIDWKLEDGKQWMP